MEKRDSSTSTIVLTVSLRASFGWLNYISTNNHGALNLYYFFTSRSLCVVSIDQTFEFSLQTVCFIPLDNKAKIATLEEEISDQKNKWTQQEGKLSFGIQAQAKC